MSSEMTGLIALGEMARNSLRVSPLFLCQVPKIYVSTQYSTLDPEEKERAFASFERRWIKFVDEIAVEVP